MSGSQPPSQRRLYRLCKQTVRKERSRRLRQRLNNAQMMDEQREQLMNRLRQKRRQPQQRLPTTLFDLHAHGLKMRPTMKVRFSTTLFVADSPPSPLSPRTPMQQEEEHYRAKQWRRALSYSNKNNNREWSLVFSDNGDTENDSDCKSPTAKKVARKLLFN